MLVQKLDNWQVGGVSWRYSLHEPTVCMNQQHTRKGFPSGTVCKKDTFMCSQLVDLMLKPIAYLVPELAELTPTSMQDLARAWVSRYPRDRIVYTSS